MTPEEALETVKDAARSWLYELGNEIIPNSDPAERADYQAAADKIAEALDALEEGA